MSSLCIRYVIYFNRKYKRLGLFQSVYKASLIEDEAYFVHISRYIHNQAIDLDGPEDGIVQPSSYPEYIGTRNTLWVHPGEILLMFSESNPLFSYERFVREYKSSKSEKSQYFDE